MVVVATCTTVLSAQKTAPVFGMDVFEDVVDHTRFDSLWRASLKGGKLDTRGVYSDAYTSYRRALSAAHPDHFLPDARIAFWVNAYLCLLMEVMSLRVGYRTTVWDSLYLTRDTAIVAGHPYTLERIADTLSAIAKTVAVRAFLSTGSSTGPPFPSHALYARTVRSELRTQLRRIIRSERYVLYDPAGNVLQLSMLFKAWWINMIHESGSVVEFLLPWMSEAMAAQVALHRSGLQVVLSDRIETWKRRR